MSLKFSGFSLQAGPAGTVNIVGYVGGTNVRMTLATLPISTLTQNALNLKAPLDSPHFTGAPEFSLGQDGIFLFSDFASLQLGSIDHTGWQMRVPLILNPRTITNGDASEIVLTDPSVIYDRTDSADLVTPPPGDGNSGQILMVVNRSPGAFDMTAVDPDSFFDGSSGLVDAITIAQNETVLFQDVDSAWSVISRSSGAAPVDSSVALGTQNFRLTTESGVPVSSGDRVSQSTLYFTPSNGNQLALYDGSKWNLFFSPEISLVLSGLIDATNYDVFVYPNSGMPTLELSAAWSGDNTPTDAIVLQDGVSVKSGAPTRRHVGTIRTTGTTTVEDSQLNRFVWNVDNNVDRRLFRFDFGNGHSYSTALWREWNGGAEGPHTLNFVCGIQQSFMVSGNGEFKGTSGQAYISIAVNSTTTSGDAIIETGAGNYQRQGLANAYLSMIGFTQLVVVELAGGGSCDFNAYNITALISA